MTYIGLGADDADVGQFCLSSEAKHAVDPFICCSPTNRTDYEDLIALEQIALCDVSSSRVEITEALVQRVSRRQVRGAKYLRAGL